MTRWFAGSFLSIRQNWPSYKRLEILKYVPLLEAVYASCSMHFQGDVITDCSFYLFIWANLKKDFLFCVGCPDRNVRGTCILSVLIATISVVHFPYAEYANRNADAVLFWDAYYLNADCLIEN